jgi:hypothetical protein
MLLWYFCPILGCPYSKCRLGLMLGGKKQASLYACNKGQCFFKFLVEKIIRIPLFDSMN